MNVDTMYLILLFNKSDYLLAVIAVYVLFYSVN